jgi:hypothetical protein
VNTKNRNLDNFGRAEGGAGTYEAKPLGVYLNGKMTYSIDTSRYLFKQCASQAQGKQMMLNMPTKFRALKSI